MRATVSRHIGKCGPCARAKVNGHPVGEYQIGETGNHPGDIWSGDVFEVGLVYDGFSHTLDFACHFSRKVISQAVKGSPSSEAIAEVVRDVLIRHNGKPREIRSDRGSNFISKAIRELYEKLGIRINPGSAYHHQSVAIVERWHRTLKQLLLSQRAAGLDGNWPARLPLLELAYNNTVHATTGFSPFFIDHGRHAVLPVDAMSQPALELRQGKVKDWVQDQLNAWSVVYDATSTALRLNSLAAKKRYDLKRAVTTAFDPGDRVLLIRGAHIDGGLPKMELPTEGPFTIHSRLPRDRYVLTDLGTRRFHDTVHVSRLVPFSERDPEPERWMLKSAENGGTWPVKRIMARRRCPATRHVPEHLEYLIRWVGFDKTYDRWRPVAELDTIQPLLTAFEEANPLPGLPPSPVLAPRATDATPPPPSLQARTTAHFRRGAPFSASLSPPPPAPPSAPPSDPSEPLEPPPPPLIPASPAPPEAPPPAENDLTDRFPVGSDVRVFYPLEKRSWDGVVTRSIVTRPRTEGQRPDRRISVRYDAAPYFGEVFEHNLTDSDVSLVPAAPITNAQLQRRSRRLQAATVPASTCAGAAATVIHTDAVLAHLFSTECCALVH